MANTYSVCDFKINFKTILRHGDAVYIIMTIVSNGVSKTLVRKHKIS